MPNLTWITLKYFPNLSPRTINSGNCYNWAYIAYMNYNDAIQPVELLAIDDFGGHAFVKIDNLYYDAESPNGIKDWKHLAFVRRSNKTPNAEPTKQNLIQFLEYWYASGPFTLIGV